jgi:hypothetical protein
MRDFRFNLSLTVGNNNGAVVCRRVRNTLIQCLRKVAVHL